MWLKKSFGVKSEYYLVVVLLSGFGVHLHFEIGTKWFFFHSGLNFRTKYKIYIKLPGRQKMIVIYIWFCDNWQKT